MQQEIAHFFSVYKDLDPERHSEPMGWADRARTRPWTRDTPAMSFSTAIRR